MLDREDELLTKAFAFLHEADNSQRLRSQQQARDLLFAASGEENAKAEPDSQIRNLAEVLAAPEAVLGLTELQREIYETDTGSAFVPPGIKKLLLKVQARLVARPATLEQLRKIVAYAGARNLHYTIRGLGTWPFGGAVPLNNELLIDLSYLDFHRLYPQAAALVAGPGAIVAKLREALLDSGFALGTEITNPNSGTLCGWIATGGWGLGAYKYGHIRESVLGITTLY